jgi:hypothetical protein
VRAWYHVGARGIVMSLWNLDDSASAELMVQFMRGVKSGAMTEFALRDALLATRRRFADPALWASVAVFGLPLERSAMPERRHPALESEPPALELPQPSTALVPMGPAGRAILHEEDGSSSAVREFTGSVTWGWVQRTDGRRELFWGDQDPGTLVSCGLVAAAQRRPRTSR